MKTIKASQTLEYFLNKDYPVVIYQADEGGFVAEIRELSGCLTQGETLDEVYERIETARKAWIEVAYEDGIEIPLPQTEQEYSGKFISRIPKSLHRRLVEQSSEDGVSLNQYVITILSGTVSEKEVASKMGEVLQEMERVVNRIKATPCIYETAIASPFDIEFPVITQYEAILANKEWRSVAA